MHAFCFKSIDFSKNGFHLMKLNAQFRKIGYDRHLNLIFGHFVFDFFKFFQIAFQLFHSALRQQTQVSRFRQKLQLMRIIVDFFLHTHDFFTMNRVVQVFSMQQKGFFIGFINTFKRVQLSFYIGFLLSYVKHSAFCFVKRTHSLCSFFIIFKNACLILPAQFKPKLFKIVAFKFSNVQILTFATHLRFLFHLFGVLHFFF